MTGFDTNIAIRALTPSDPLHTRCFEAVSAVEESCVAEPTLRETYRIVTGSRNGQGLAPADGLRYVARIRRAHRVLPPTAGTMAIWEDLLRRTGVVGVRTYDAYLAAVLLSHGVTEIVTLDADFSYPGLRTVLP